MNNYFNLSPECFLVVGEKRAAVYNLNSGDIISLDEVQTNALILAESKNAIEEIGTANVFEYLAEKGWGFFSSKPFFVDKIRPMNIFGERRIWLQRPQFIMAILQLTEKCDKACDNCRKTFCPICFSDPLSKQSPISVEQWKKIIDKIASAGCKSIMFTGGESLLYNGLEQLVDHAIGTDMEVCVHTNGQIAPKKIPENVGLNVLIDQNSDLQLVLRNIKGRKKVSLILQNIQPALINFDIDKTWEVRTSNSYEPVRGKKQLKKVKMNDFFYIKLKDSCLNGKMFILSDGNVVPCFQGRDKKIGNLVDEDFNEVYRRLTVDYWYASIDQRTSNQKCRQCEFKYACSVCRFSNPDVFCQYDPLQSCAHSYSNM